MPGADQIPDTDRADRRRERASRRIGRRPAAGLAVFAGIVLALAAAPARAQTMTQALAEAYNTNPQLLAQRALLRATDEQVPQALSGWRPTVNFTGQVGGVRAGFIAPPNSAYSTFFQNSVNLQITQPVYSGGRTLAQTRQAINTVQATRAQTLAVETSVFQAVAQAYLDVVRDQALVEVDRNNVAVLRKQLEATQDRFRVGEVTRTDVAQAESSLAQAIGTLTAAEGTLRQSQAEYVRAVGHPPGRLLLPRERPTLPATREEAQTLAADNNFNVISANFAELAARDNIAVVRGQLLPQISIVGTLARAEAPSITFTNALENTGTIAAQMTMPLYEGGAIYSQTRQAEQTVGQRRSQVDDARRAAVQTATAELGNAEGGARQHRLVRGSGARRADRPGRDPAGGAGRHRHDARRADPEPAALYHPVAADRRRARFGARRIQPRRGDRPADRPRPASSGAALRHGAALQGGEGQMVRLWRRSEGMTGSRGRFRWKIRRPLPSLAGSASFLPVPPMSDTKLQPQPANAGISVPEPSMEEIIASISRIIAEDNRSADARSAAALRAPADRGDVLELTEAIAAMARCAGSRRSARRRPARHRPAWGRAASRPRRARHRASIPSRSAPSRRLRPARNAFCRRRLGRRGHRLCPARRGAAGAAGRGGSDHRSRRAHARRDRARHFAAAAAGLARRPSSGNCRAAGRRGDRARRRRGGAALKPRATRFGRQMVARRRLACRAVDC